MATVGRLAFTTRESFKSMPGLFVSLIGQIAAGTNPHVQFHFTEVRVIRSARADMLILDFMLMDLSRGTEPHHSHTDLQEVRKSITIQFNGVSGGPIVAHLFNDGTIKTSTQMHQEINQRRAKDIELTAAENRFPALGQTTARKQAEDRMMARIMAARANNSWSIIQKQLEKDSAEQEYRLVLQAQAQARAAAT